MKRKNKKRSIDPVYSHWDTHTHNAYKNPHTHISLMPLWGTIWWKNAKRLLECDPVLQAPRWFDMLVSPPHACWKYWDILSMHIPTRTNPRYKWALNVRTVAQWTASLPAEQSKPEPQSGLCCKTCLLKHLSSRFSKSQLFRSFKSLSTEMKNVNILLYTKQWADNSLINMH